MTESEVWQAMEQYLKEGDHTGCLVLADRLEELNLVEEAATVRFCVPSGVIRFHPLRTNPKRLWSVCFGDADNKHRNFATTCPSLRQCVAEATKVRLRVKEVFGV